MSLVSQTPGNDSEAVTACSHADNRPVNKRVLVTGGAGFVGSHLVDALVAENEVTLLDDLSSGQRSNVHPDARFIEGDVRDPSTVADAVAETDLIFHQAGLVSVEAATADPPRSNAINAGGTVTVLDCARKADARVVTASSAAIYGQPEHVPISESEPVAPQSPYGADKLAADQYTRLFADLYGMETVTLRYFNVYGPGQSAASYSGVITTFLDQAEAGEALTIDGDGSQTRDFVHIDDVVEANMRAAETDHVGLAYNVGTSEETSINDLAAAVCEVCGREPAVTHGRARPGDVDRSCADISRAREKLGFEPTVSLRTGLKTVRERPDR